jgi:hypothetical protein
MSKLNPYININPSGNTDDRQPVLGLGWKCVSVSGQCARSYASFAAVPSPSLAHLGNLFIANKFDLLRLEKVLSIAKTDNNRRRSTF